MAIGASGGRVRMMVLKQVAQMTAIGSLAGIAFWEIGRAHV